MTMLGRTMLTSLIATGLLLALPVAAPAQITDVTIRVDGLSCPFCAYGIEKQLKKLEGAENPIIDVKEGTVTLVSSSDGVVDFDALSKAIKQAGFTPREIHVAGIGRVEVNDGRSALVSEDGRELFLLQKNDVLAGLDAGSISSIRFTGTLAPREKKAGAAQARKLALSTAEPVERDEERN